MIPFIRQTRIHDLLFLLIFLLIHSVLFPFVVDTLSAAWPPTSFPAESKWNLYGGSQIESFLIFSVAFDFLIESLGKKGVLRSRRTPHDPIHQARQTRIRDLLFLLVFLPTSFPAMTLWLWSIVLFTI